MKHRVRNYITFSRKERVGILVLSVVIIILLAVRLSVPYLVHPVHDTVQEKRLLLAWQHYKAQHLLPASLSDDSAAASLDIWDEGSDYNLARVNINSADSPMLEALRGIGPVTAGSIVRYRQEHGLYKNVSQLFEAHSIPERVFKTLEPYLTVTDSL